MALKVKEAAQARSKFVSRGGIAGPEYAEGVKTAGESWQRETLAAEENYNNGVTAAIQRRAFVRGVSASGADHFQMKASTVGARRFPEGIRDAGQAYEDGVRPMLDVLRALDLPPRRPRGDPANTERVARANMALRAKKLGR